MPNILLVYPEFPPSYWNFNYALRFVGRKAVMPPLGLLTVAGMIPKGNAIKVVDMNVTPLLDADIKAAHVVMLSAMLVQKACFYEIVERCNRAGVPVVAGGPFPTSYYNDIRKEVPGKVDHFFLGEGEGRFLDFLTDLRMGKAKEIYEEPRTPDGRRTLKPAIAQTPFPRFDLLDLSVYASMALQFSRGCPFDCEFCDITTLFGRVPRTKTNEQMIAEFDLLYNLGWRGSLFLVDDNFIGNKRRALELLPIIAEWQQSRQYPFSLYTEASVNLAEMDPLLEGMVRAGFNMVFLGIETVTPETLVKIAKPQNTKKDENGYVENYLFDAVRKIQRKGMEVTGGFILGLDGDRESVFDAQITFVQEAGIPMAMVGLPTVLKDTHMYTRLQHEDRLLKESTGDNVSTDLNFVPEMDRHTLTAGYRRVLSTIYDPGLKNYFARCLTLLDNLAVTEHSVRRVGRRELLALARSVREQLFSRQGVAYSRFLFRVLRDHPRMFPEAVRLAIMGYHLEKMTRQVVVA